MKGRSLDTNLMQENKQEVSEEEHLLHTAFVWDKSCSQWLCKVSAAGAQAELLPVYPKQPRQTKAWFY